MLMPTILLLEDEALIAFDIERTLEEAQLGQTVSLESCARAVKWLEDNTPDVAIVDIFLRDGECDEVAEILVARGVPLVVHSARRGVASDNHRIFLNGKWICKPSDPNELMRAVEESLRRSCSAVA